MWGSILFNPFILLLISFILFTVLTSFILFAGLASLILLNVLICFILFDGSEDVHKLFESFDLNSFDG
jgi:hypothetical protein